MEFALLSLNLSELKAKPMRTIWIITLTILTLSALSSCHTSKRDREVEQVDLTIRIERLDQAMDLWLRGEIDSLQIQEQYGPFLSIYGRYVLESGPADNPDFWLNSRSFLSDSALQRLYQDELNYYRDLSAIEQELTYGFKWLKLHFPSIATPRVMMHFSALNQSIVVAEGVISASGDKYLGASYPLYQQLFDSYQTRLMDSSSLSQDYLYGWVASELPSHTTNSTLLEEIIYRGKLLYFVSQMLPDRSEQELLNYTPEELQWCRSNSENIWRYLGRNELLYTRSSREILKWVSEAPNSSFIQEQTPSKVGVWLGYQIVKQYIEHHQISAHALYEVAADQNFVAQSKYRP